MNNTLKRFSTFWIGCILFVAFGLASLVLGIGFNKPVVNNIDKVNAKRRAMIKRGVDKSHAGAREKALLSFERVGSHFLNTAPAPDEKPEFVLPGSATQKRKASGGSGIVVPAGFPTIDPDAPVDVAVMEQGKAMFAICSACHGPEGKGMYHINKTGPPLANSEWVTGPVANLIAIQFRGLSGPIEVNGEKYTPVAPMAPLPLDNNSIAAVLTYIRNSFGNKASPVTPEQVEAMRGELGKPMLSPADLIPPTAAAGSN
ncbi:MAG: c-type cytochrome [Roseibacillus sp.]|nr:c-type cytochrome [Roseibacillus sp.]